LARLYAKPHLEGAQRTEVKEDMTDVWDTTEEAGGVRIHLPDGNVVEQEGSITAQELSSLAKSNGLRKFVVKKDGETLSPADFPVSSGELYIEEYNEAK